jgi:hypothetical protein
MYVCMYVCTHAHTHTHTHSALAGMPQATGFVLRAKVMGLAVTYHVGTLETVPAVPEHLRGTPEALKVN